MTRYTAGSATTECRVLAPPEGKCLLHFDLISSVVSISKIHWISVLVYLRQRAVYVLNSMGTAEVCMSPTSAC